MTGRPVAAATTDPERLTGVLAGQVPPFTTPAVWARFSRKVVWTPSCWFWVGALADDGYGRFADETGRIVRSSRWLFQAWHGPLVPASLVVMHEPCDEPSCARPDHLVAGTQAENLTAAARRDRVSNRWLWGAADRRGMAARSRAIREALRGGYDPDRLAAAMSLGDPRANQPALF